MAVTLAALLAAAGYAGLLPIACAFVPMLGIALAYRRLNRWDQSAGATYTWVSKALHPYLGFVTGWMILMYYALGTISMTVPAGAYTLQLVAPGLVGNKVAVALVGGAWNVIVTLPLLAKIEIAARFQKAGVGECRVAGELGMVHAVGSTRKQRISGRSSYCCIHVLGLGRGDLRE